MAAAAAEELSRGGSALPAEWPRSRVACVVRAALQAIVLLPIVRMLCRPFRVEGARRFGRWRGPFVFVANHASHADTAVILAALPRRLRKRTAAAAAEDYFFRGRLRGTLAAIGIGAFPFPRRGSAGLERAEQLLARGWNVLLFPEGTRSRDGRMGRFKPGAGILASRGAIVVPVGIAGTRDILPKNARLPRRAPVAVVFGEPVNMDRGTPAPIAAQRLERTVSRFRAAARLLRPAPRRSWMHRAASFARSPRAVWFALGCGIAEALVWPIVPDVPVALLAAAAPSRFLVLAGAATAGSLAGGTLAYLLGGTDTGAWLLTHAPLVTERMRENALSQMSEAGAGPLLAQPWTGIPYKVFAYQASGADVPFGAFAGLSALGRGHRIVLAGATFAGAFCPLHRAAPRWVDRLYAPFVLTFCVVFGLGLARVVAAWS